MGNQVHSIHLPDSSPFLKGALAWALWCSFANRLFTDSVDGFPVLLLGRKILAWRGRAGNLPQDREGGKALY